MICCIEEEKNGSQVRESTESWEESWWIDIKKGTEKVEKEQITKLLRRDLFGDDGESSSDDVLYYSFEHLRLGSDNVSSQPQEVKTLFKDLLKLLWKEKSVQISLFSKRTGSIGDMNLKGSQ